MVLQMPKDMKLHAMPFWGCLGIGNPRLLGFVQACKSENVSSVKGANIRTQAALWTPNKYVSGSPGLCSQQVVRKNQGHQRFLICVSRIYGSRTCRHGWTRQFTFVEHLWGLHMGQKLRRKIGFLQFVAICIIWFLLLARQTGLAAKFWGDISGHLIFLQFSVNL